MASEQSEGRVVSVTLPDELTDWLDEKAAELDVEDDVLVAQLLASYRATEALDGAGEPGEGVELDVESAVRDVVANRISDIAAAVERQLDGLDDLEDIRTALDDLEDVQTALQDLEDTQTAVQDLKGDVERLESEVSSAESEFQSKLEDVRGRVIQVKKETDSKAPADHTHPELESLEQVGAKVAQLESEVDTLESALETQGSDLEDAASRLTEAESYLTDVESHLTDVEEKLDTIAWVVSDLREAQQKEDRAIDQLKQKAAKEDVDRAVCDNCSNSVDIALLTEPNCPHCDATVNDVRLPSGFFGKPHLSVARQLEAGNDSERADSTEYGGNVPDAARR